MAGRVGIAEREGPEAETEVRWEAMHMEPCATGKSSIFSQSADGSKLNGEPGLSLVWTFAGRSLGSTQLQRASLVAYMRP